MSKHKTRHVLDKLPRKMEIIGNKNQTGENRAEARLYATEEMKEKILIIRKKQRKIQLNIDKTLK